jgi:hypothetical protein
MNNMPNITVVKQTVTVNSRYLWDSMNKNINNWMQLFTGYNK